MSKLAQRAHHFLPFQAVELFKQAQALQRDTGRDIISLGIGEPDFTAPPLVIEALDRAARSGLSGYCPPAGLAPLREAIARFYRDMHDVHVDPERIIVTSGASGALSLACAALLDEGAEVLMPDPTYPANRNFVHAAGGKTRLMPTLAANHYQPTAQDVAAHWSAQTRGVLLASPGNPTGTSIDPSEMERILAEVRRRDGFAIIDEIYLGLTYDGKRPSALQFDDNAIIINSFSKYFNMTGWRLGWLIAPRDMVPTLEKIVASLSICASTLAQHAALACFEPESLALYETRRQAFQARRDYLLPAFETLGLDVLAKPDGAFYIYADISRFGQDSEAFSQRLLLEAGVAAVPGTDFGPTHGARTLRFSYATQMDKLHEAVARMHTLLG